MSQTSNTELSTRAYDILRTSGKDADFIYDTMDKYIQDAEKDSRSDLVAKRRLRKQIS